MKLGSLFDGSGGFPLSGALCGIEPAWAAEVEPYPIAVTRSRFPNMKHLGDISKVSGADIEPVDVITFGSPCQDLSVAGKRAGLKHEANGDEETTRSGLFMEAVRIIKEMREATNGLYPRFALWENVPGAFSSNKGEDFRIVCEELIKIVEPRASMPSVPSKGWPYSDSYCGDGWSLAYRVFDAQYWGVPQRRRRIHLVVDFRGECAREILFEREGLRGYFAEGRTSWQIPAAHAQDCAGADDRAGEGEGGAGGRQLDAVAYTLKVRSGCDVDSSGKSAGKGALIQIDKAATLATVQDQYLFQPVCMATQQGGAEIRTDDKAPTLTAAAGMSGNNQPVVAFAQNQCDEVRFLGDKAGALQAQPGMKQQTFILDNIGGQAEYGKASLVNGTLRAGGQGAIAYVVENHPADSRVNLDESGKVQTLTSRMGTGGGNVPMVMEGHPTAQLASGKDVTGCLMASGYEKLGAQEMFSGDYTVIEAQPVVYDGANITSPVNASNPQPGGPCHTLSTDSRNILVDPVYCLQGNGIDRADTAGCNGKGWKEDQSYTLNTIDRPAVAYGTDVGFFNSLENQSPTLLARGYKDPHLVTYSGDAMRYIVRRLTPTECARLQGFADRWGDIEKKDFFSEEEFHFWNNVRNTHAAINGKKVQDYTEVQILAWYNKLHTDSAEYKMWGNGIALPPALYCMQGIVEALNKADDDSWLM